MISIKIFEDYNKNLSEILNKLIKKNKIELFQSEEWLKTNLDIYNCNNDIKVYFVVCFKESEPCIFLPLTVKLLNGVRILTWLDSPANDYCGAIISNDIKNNGRSFEEMQNWLHSFSGYEQLKTLSNKFATSRYAKFK